MDVHEIRSHRAPKASTKAKRNVLIAAAAVGLSAAMVAATFASSPVSALDGLSPLELAQAQKANCQLLAESADNAEQLGRARDCVEDQTAIIVRLSPPTSTPPATTAPPTTVPPTTAPPTTPPVTTTTSRPPTTTAPPTTPPPTTPAPQNGCLAHPGACGFPDAASTGARGTLTVVTGDVTITSAGLVFENKDVRGCIHVRASNVVIRNVKVTCGQNFTAAIAHETGALLTVQDVTLDCAWHGQSATGVWGDHTRVDRADIRGCENGFDIYRDWRVTNSYMHELYDAGDAHTDGAQVVATGGNGAPGGDIVFDHNTWMVSGVTTSAIIADHCACTNLTITNNLISGAPNAQTSSGPAYMIYCPKPSAVSSGVSVTGNRFGLLGPTIGGKRQSPWGRGSNCGNFAWGGNVDDASGATVGP